MHVSYSQILSSVIQSQEIDRVVTNVLKVHTKIATWNSDVGDVQKHLARTHVTKPDPKDLAKLARQIYEEALIEMEEYLDEEQHEDLDIAQLYHSEPREV